MVARSKLVEIGVIDGLPEAEFDQIVEMAASILGSQVSLFSVIDDPEDRQFFKSATGLPAPVAAQRQTPMSHSFCKTVVAEAKMLNISDAREDPRFQNHPAIEGLGVVAYLGAPIIAGEDGAIGALCAINDTPRTWSAQEEQNIATLAKAISRIIAHRLTIQREADAVRGLREISERFRMIADATSDVLWDFDFESGLTWTSLDWAAKLGIYYDQPNIQNFQWVEIVDPTDRAPLIKSFQEAIKSQASTWQFEFKAQSAAGGAINVVLMASILRNQEGRASRILGNMRNITREKRNQEGYTRARALEAVGQLTGGVAHDFNNLLMIILGNAEMLETTALDEDQAESVAMIQQASNSAADLTRRLLSFSRQSQLHPGPVNLTNLILNTVALLRTGIPETIAIRCNLQADIWQAKVDANALEQAIVNLAVNARDAMPHGGEIVICCDNQTISSDVQSDLSDLEPRDYVIVSVTDSGQGMSPEVLARAFEPFFTTKDVGEGTGLGLSTVFGFAKQSGGYATIQTEPGHGTTVKMHLPRYEKSDEQERPSSEAKHAEGQTGQRILMVEDEPLVRAHVEKLLSRLGYHVTAAQDAREALSFLRDGQTFDLLFTDVIMPGGMTGPQLGQAGLKLAPKMKLLYTSGYPAAAFENLGIEDTSSVNFLSKPYRSAQLRDKLIAIFDI